MFPSVNIGICDVKVGVIYLLPWTSPALNPSIVSFFSCFKIFLMMLWFFPMLLVLLIHPESAFADSSLSSSAI